MFNPLSSKSDQHEISPHNIDTSSREKVIRINGMNTRRKLHTIRKCMEISEENLYVDIGA